MRWCFVKDFKVILNMPDGKKVWINILHVIKMEITPDGHYFLFLANGETYHIDKDIYEDIKDYFDD